MPAKVWESVEKPCMDYKPHQNSTSHMRIYQKLQVTYVTSERTCNVLTLSQARLFIKIKRMIQPSARNSITCILLLTQKFYQKSFTQPGSPCMYCANGVGYTTYKTQQVDLEMFV